MGTRLTMTSRLHFSGSLPCRIMSTISLTQVVPGEEQPGVLLLLSPPEPNRKHRSTFWPPPKFQLG